MSICECTTETTDVFSKFTFDAIPKSRRISSNPDAPMERHHCTPGHFQKGIYTYVLPCELLLLLRMTEKGVGSKF